MKTKENNDFKNASFNTKKEKHEKSDLWITNSLVKYDDWNVKNIIERQKELADIAVKAWSIKV
jgi:hypothetical protein